MMQYLAKTLLLLWTLLAATAEARTLVLAASNNPPFYGRELPQQGALTQIIREALAIHGHDLEVKFLPWTRAMEWAKSGVVDGMIGVWHTPERAQQLHFSDPILTSRMVLYKRREDPIRYEQPLDLQGKNYRLGLVRGYVLPKDLRQTNLEIMRVTRNNQYFRILAGKRVDLVVVNNEYAHHLLQQSDHTDIANGVEQVGDVVGVENQHLVLTKHRAPNDMLIQEFNLGLKLLRQNGRFRTIIEQHNFEKIDEADALFYQRQTSEDAQ
ncbi:transporter substrate-binding domain-containing protein [Maricurvus nonylphenolicus]|uniref:substrate-binding periplasmic protein n=1 Tax=Maricurvus nonylphenolicus TaxID=1008307 RepID=UPI0036F43889